MKIVTIKGALDNLVHCKSITRCKECKHKNLCTMERDYNIIKKDLERLEIYEKFTIPNLRKLILKLYNNEELTREEHEIIFEIMSLKNKELENEHENI